MADVKLIREDGIIRVSSPYDNRFVKKVKEIGGKWNAAAKTWDVSEEVEERLKIILTKYYGYVESEADLIKVRYKAEDFNNNHTDDIRISSLVTVMRNSRDREVIFDHNTIVLQGGFPSRGGSAKYPRPEPYSDTILQSIIPKSVYDGLSDIEKSKIEVIDQKTEKEKLLAEREILLNRLAQIDEKLKTL